MLELINALGVGASLLIAGWSVFGTAVVGLVLLSGDDTSVPRGKSFVFFGFTIGYGLLSIATMIGWALTH